MREPIINVKALFAQNLEDEHREREILVRARIQSFYNRHRIAETDAERNPQGDTKVRSLYK